MCPTGAGILANLTKMQEPFPSNQFNDVSENAVTFINAMPCHIRKKIDKNLKPISSSVILSIDFDS